MLFQRYNTIIKFGNIFILFALSGFILQCYGQYNYNNNSTKKPINNKFDMPEPSGKLYMNSQLMQENPAIMGFMSDRSIVASNIREIVRRSTDIIVGRVLTHRAFLNADGTEIHNIKTVYVQNVYKGEILNASGIFIKLLGGSWLYSDGTFISWRPIDMMPIRDEKSYIFFLMKDGESEYYIPSLGPQSIFGLDPDTYTIIPVDLFDLSPVAVKYKNIPIVEFTREIKNLVREEF